MYNYPVKWNSGINLIQVNRHIHECTCVCWWMLRLRRLFLCVMFFACSILSVCMAKSRSSVSRKESSTAKKCERVARVCGDFKIALPKTSSAHTWAHISRRKYLYMMRNDAAVCVRVRVLYSLLYAFKCRRRLCAFVSMCVCAPKIKCVRVAASKCMCMWACVFVASAARLQQEQP